MSLSGRTRRLSHIRNHDVPARTTLSTCYVHRFLVTAVILLTCGSPAVVTADQLTRPEGKEAGASSEYQDIRDLVRLGGVWRSHGYGWIWSVEAGRVETYDAAGDLCIKNANPDFDVEDPYIRFQIDGSQRGLRAIIGDYAYVYTFDRIDALPKACTMPQQSDPISVVEHVDQYFRAHYAFFEARGINWREAINSARSRVNARTTDRELFEVLKALLSPFNDSHVSLEANLDDESTSYYPANSRPRQSLGNDAAPGYWNPYVVGKLLGDTKRTGAENRIEYGLIEGGMGYLAINSMEGYEGASLDETLDNAMELFRGASAVVVDVSLNGGGYDTIARQIAERFATRPAVAYYKHAGDAEAGQPQGISLMPSERPRYTGPVYLITGRTTVSAAEVFVLAMRSLPNVMHIGESTDGSLSNVLSKRLPNGWVLTLSNEVYSDSAGVLWEGKGIPPQRSVKIAQERPVSEGDVEAARTLVNYLLQLP